MMACSKLKFDTEGADVFSMYYQNLSPNFPMHTDPEHLKDSKSKKFWETTKEDYEKAVADGWKPPVSEVLESGYVQKPIADQVEAPKSAPDDQERPEEEVKLPQSANEPDQKDEAEDQANDNRD